MADGRPPPPVPRPPRMLSSLPVSGADSALREKLRAMALKPLAKAHSGASGAPPRLPSNWLYFTGLYFQQQSLPPRRTHNSRPLALPHTCLLVRHRPLRSLAASGICSCHS